jgi:hypothetical protein
VEIKKTGKWTIDETVVCHPAFLNVRSNRHYHHKTAGSR